MVAKLSDGSYKIETSNGDILYFMASEVKQVKNIYNKKQKIAGRTNKDDLVIRRGNMLCFSSSGQALTEEAFSNIESWQKYQKQSKAGKNARIALYSGLGAFVVGDVMIIGVLSQGLGSRYRNYGINAEIVDTGIVVGSVGLVTTIIGAFLIKKSNINLNTMAKAYSQTPGYVFNLGVQQHGIGFALNF